ncbi:inositol-pentakisphosphate 2-kinase [Rhipicephalus sanguineus]|uniref:inositol-pentakisphosphate 2-kinase n=1 Tax=Rhipicephalus sanguineus TaxID=34632 RepID=UPI0018956251|nr:inositol-pentakisphosphate 2-kinase [Rhipicephalus sanguineus]
MAAPTGRDRSGCDPAEKLLISPENCAFRGEGNANIVVTLKNEDRVLRLRKSAAFTEDTISLIGESLQKCHMEADFIENVMKPLFGSRFVHPPVLVRLTAENVRLINKAVHLERPLHRLKKNVKEVATVGLLFPDHCTLPSHLRKYAEGPVISIEIKPKQGFLPSPHDLPFEHKVRSSVCRFHLSQTSKVSKGRISSVSMYCPLDLFSGCPKRMKSALRELLYHPQNNLRVFKNKKLVFSEESRTNLEDALKDFFLESSLVSRDDNLCHLVTKILRHSYPETGAVSAASGVWDVAMPQSCPSSHPCTCTTRMKADHRLPRGCILDRVLQAQRLGSIDVSTAYPLYLSLKDTLHCAGEKPPLLEYLKDGYPAPFLPKAMGCHDRQNYETDHTFACRKIWEFLVALTARDCSIMLSLQRLSSAAKVLTWEEDYVVEDAYGQAYLFSLAVVDLDPKSVDKLEKVYFDDCSMIRTACS